MEMRKRSREQTEQRNKSMEKEIASQARHIAAMKAEMVQREKDFEDHVHMVNARHEKRILEKDKQLESKDDEIEEMTVRYKRMRLKYKTELRRQGMDLGASTSESESSD